MEKTKTYKIELDGDLQGLSIGVTESFIIDGELVSKPMKRRAFRKLVKTDDAIVENANFEKEVDEWVGETNFIKNKVNF